MRLKLFASFLARFSSRYSSCGDAQAVERASTIKRKTSILRRLAPAATNRGVLHFSPSKDFYLKSVVVGQANSCISGMLD